ncbi:MAG TPA: cation diffusion facilitator family transporter [Propionibacteriaceae bacterium]|nr:cation diffusion facilitator family transporter [Propionibacteriaceae bacterium]
MDDVKSARDQRLLMFSIWASAGFAVLASVWGILSGSSMIVFDGLYSFVSIGLSVLAVLALRFSRRGADERFPWGREAAEPLVVVIKAASLGALCAYAAIGGILDIVNGGRPVAVGSAVVYALVATLGGLVVGLVLRRATRGEGSGLVRAEAAEWLGDTLLSFGVLIGFLVAYVLVVAGRADLAAYVDPGMVTLVSLAFLWVPIKLIVSSLREIMSMAPEADVLDQLRARVAAAEEKYAFSESFLRASKVGDRMDIEIDFVVGAESPVRTITDGDAVRQDLHDQLEALGYQRSVVVTFTADRRWAA